MLQKSSNMNLKLLDTCVDYVSTSKTINKLNTAYIKIKHCGKDQDLNKF